MAGPWDKYQNAAPEAGPWAKYGTVPVQPVPEQPKGFLGSIGEALSRRGTNIGAELPGLAQGSTHAESALRILGQGAGLLSDVQGAALKSAYQNVVPQGAQNLISSDIMKALSTQAGQMGLSALRQGGEAYGAFRQNYPNVAKDIEAVANIGSLLPTAKVAQAEKVIGKEGVGVFKDLSALTTAARSPEMIDKSIESTVKQGMEKAIRPSVVGKANAVQTAAYYGKAKDAVESIVGNKANLTLTDEAGNVIKGELPKNLKQFSEAIGQTKRKIFTEYDNLSKTATSLGEAGKSGAVVDLKPIAQDLEKIANDKGLRLASPGSAKYAMDAAKRYKATSELTATEAQDVIQHLNNSLEAYYKNPTYDTASKAYLDAMIANKMRGSLDSVIEKTTGQEYQALKNQYGALKSIEADVSKRAIVDARKNAKGLIDFTDVFSGSEVVNGILSLSPAKIATGATAKAISSYIKFKNNPNQMIENLFKNAENLMSIKNKGFTPQSAIGQAIASPKQAIKNIPVKEVAKTAGAAGAVAATRKRKWKTLGDESQQ